MKIQRINAGEVWVHAKRVGLIIEEWFYPVPGAQLSAEELSQIAQSMKAEHLTREEQARRQVKKYARENPLASDMTDHISEVLRPGDTL